MHCASTDHKNHRCGEFSWTFLRLQTKCLFSSFFSESNRPTLRLNAPLTPLRSKTEQLIEDVITAGFFNYSIRKLRLHVTTNYCSDTVAVSLLIWKWDFLIALVGLLPSYDLSELRCKAVLSPDKIKEAFVLLFVPLARHKQWIMYAYASLANGAECCSDNSAVSVLRNTTSSHSDLF